MSSFTIKNNSLKQRLNNISDSDWIKFARGRGLLVVSGSGSHYANVRNPENPDKSDPRGLITTITNNCFKQANESIFKKFLKFGIPEDDIWKGLGLMD
jgi:predicted HAD superfamily phosphohydrolase